MRNRIPLLFSLVQPDPGVVPDVARFVAYLNAARDWATGGIELVNVRDADSATLPDDKPIWTLGGVLWLDAPGANPDERRQFEDVRFLLDQLCRLSASHGELVVEYNGEEVGSITGGRLDESLSTGLLAEWQRHLRSP
jgi:hypothetical protein